MRKRRSEGKLRKNRNWGGEVLDGGVWLPTLVEEDAEKLLQEVYPLCLILAWFLAILPLFYFTFLFLSLIFMISSIFSGLGFTEKSQFTEGRSSASGDWGAGKNWSSSGRIGGGRSVWTPEGSHIAFLHILCPTPPKKACHTPSTTVSRLPHQESEEAVPEASAPVAKDVKQVPEAASPAASPAIEVAIPAQMTPLLLQLGHIKRVYKCQVEGCTEGPITSHAAICTHVHREHVRVRLVCPFCANAFFNSDALRYHKKTHSDL